MKRNYHRTPRSLDWMPLACAALVALAVIAVALAGPSEAHNPGPGDRGIPSAH